jgi:transcriptional regulator GlxA family with amidase domain
MSKANLAVVKSVIETSHLTNKMVAEAFGYESADALNIEFLNSFGMSVAEFRQRCKEAPDSDLQQEADVG